MEACVDGEYQNFKSKGGAYTREHFFGSDPDTAAMVANMSDEEIWRLNRGGHDAHKVYAAYASAIAHKGQPTVILAHTVKGFGLGKAAEGQMVAHQQKKMDAGSLASFRENLGIQLSGRGHRQASRSASPPKTARRSATSSRAARRSVATCRSATRMCRRWQVPPLETFKALLDGSGDREISTTMAFVRILTALLKDKNIGKNIVPIVPDEARTFGMEGLFRQIGIYSAVGQLYTPQDADQLMSYKEDSKGQMLEEGINEAGVSLLVDRGRHRLCELQADHGAVLHLLLDVRLPARGRLHLGGGRHPGARLPAGRDRRPHDAGRRRPAAPGRPQPDRGDDGAELPRLRSCLCL